MGSLITVAGRHGFDTHNYDNAIRDLVTAVNLEPSNVEYRRSRDAALSAKRLHLP
jgi:hypothetical protein